MLFGDAGSNVTIDGTGADMFVFTADNIASGVDIIIDMSSNFLDSP